MGQAYADGIAKIQTPGTLILCIVLTAAVAVLGTMRWAEKVLKKQAATLK